jgi:NADPH:quinone reductase-like Zn-dependent oxidoreductase
MVGWRDRGSRMIAAYTRYGPPDVVEVGEIEKLVPNDGEVLIKVFAASVNPLDWKTMGGGPHVVRAMLGLRRPKIRRLGVDVAGRVEAVGRDVTEFKPGDEVFGTCRGAFAEYACACEPARLMKSALARKPENVTFEQAAAAPVAALTALQGLRDQGWIQPGQRVLVNGAAGGVGTFAVQIAKAFGADVTGVCSTRNVDMVRSIGADRVIDYTQQDFTKSWERYDIFFDCVGNRSLSSCRRILNPRGVLVMVGAPKNVRVTDLLGRLIGALVMSPFLNQKLVPFISRSNREDLGLIRELMSNGKVKPVIDRLYSLSEVPEALNYLKGGHAQGKVVIVVQERPEALLV